jgi:hypothetical protein
VTSAAVRRAAVLKAHPIADLFPLLSGPEFEALVEGMRAHGYDARHPVLTFKGQILDGRNRYRAAKAAGVEAVVCEWTGDDPWGFVWRENAVRRHLEPGQQAALFVKFTKGSDEWLASQTKVQGEARARGSKTREQKKRGTAVSRETAVPSQRERVRIAAAAGVSPATAARALELQKKAPAEFEAVARGEVTLNRALKNIKFADAMERAAAQTRASAVVPTVRKQSAVDFIKSFKPATVDLGLTDPPYATDIENIEAFAAEWLPLFLSRIKPTGRAYVCIGAYPRELAAYLNAAAKHGWMPEQILPWVYRNTLGPAPTHKYKQNWQAILYWIGPKAPPLDCPVMTEQFAVQDINAPDGRLGDRFHAWQKPDELAERFVRHSSKPNDLVIDPFVCTGTFIIAAAKLGRRSIGCDIDPENLKIAVNRGCKHER